MAGRYCLISQMEVGGLILELYMNISVKDLRLEIREFLRFVYLIILESRDETFLRL